MISPVTLILATAGIFTCGYFLGRIHGMQIAERQYGPMIDSAINMIEEHMILLLKPIAGDKDLP